MSGKQSYQFEIDPKTLRRRVARILVLGDGARSRHMPHFGDKQRRKTMSREYMKNGLVQTRPSHDRF